MDGETRQVVEPDEYIFRGQELPARLRAGIDRYVEEGVRPGQFLCAVLANNLADAIGRADDDSLESIAAVVGYVFNEIPSVCWGDRASIYEWCERRRKERGEEQIELTATPGGLLGPFDKRRVLLQVPPHLRARSTVVEIDRHLPAGCNVAGGTVWHLTARGREDELRWTRTHNDAIAPGTTSGARTCGICGVDLRGVHTLELRRSGGAREDTIAGDVRVTCLSVVSADGVHCYGVTL